MRGDPATPGPARRRHALAASGVALAAVLGVTGCGQQAPATSVVASTGGSTTGDDEVVRDPPRVVRLGAGDERPRLSCPTDERSLIVADFAVGARGAATPQEAVGLSSLESGERMVVSASGTRVWILRADGTAREDVHLMHLRGWLLHLREACA